MIQKLKRKFRLAGERGTWVLWSAEYTKKDAKNTAKQFNDEVKIIKGISRDGNIRYGTYMKYGKRLKKVI
jgi:hypothetical protein